MSESQRGLVDGHCPLSDSFEGERRQIANLTLMSDISGVRDFRFPCPPHSFETHFRYRNNTILSPTQSTLHFIRVATLRMLLKFQRPSWISRQSPFLSLSLSLPAVPLSTFNLTAALSMEHTHTLSSFKIQLSPLSVQRVMVQSTFEIKKYFQFKVSDLRSLSLSGISFPPLVFH